MLATLQPKNPGIQTRYGDFLVGIGSFGRGFKVVETYSVSKG